VILVVIVAILAKKNAVGGKFSKTKIVVQNATNAMTAAIKVN
jgi:hypothetical protein